jgi:mediator of RNA polymerase II transcription subunit 17
MRTLLSLGVRCKGDTILCPLSPSKTIILDLVSQDDYSPAPPNKDDKLAEGISLALHILLSYSHRLNFRRRTQPPGPLSAFRRPNAPYPLLRSLITRANHQLTLLSVYALMDSVSSILTLTSLSPRPIYTITELPLPEHITKMAPTESTIVSLVDQLQSQVTLNITASCILVTKIRTSQFPLTNTNFNLTLEPEDCVLQETCCAPGVVDHWRKAHDYILFATSCALASSFTSAVYSHEKTTTEEKLTQPPRWESTTRPHMIRLSPAYQEAPRQAKSKQLSFSLSPFSSPESEGSKGGLKLRVAWEWIGDVVEHSSTGSNALDSETAPEWKAANGEGFYEWSVLQGKSAVVGRGAAGEKDTWGEGAPIKSLEDVVEIAGRL